MIIVIMALLLGAVIAIVSMIRDSNNEETILMKDNKRLFFLCRTYKTYICIKIKPE